MIDCINDGIVDTTEIVLTLALLNEEAEATEEMEENDGNIFGYTEIH